MRITKVNIPATARQINLLHGLAATTPSAMRVFAKII